MSAAIEQNVSNPNVNDVDITVEPNIEEYVRTAEFVLECHKTALSRGTSPFGEGRSSGDERLFRGGDNDSGATPMTLAIRDQVVALLDRREIKVTSVDFVRFTWLDEYTDQEVSDDAEDDGDGKKEQALIYDDISRIQPAQYENRHYTNPTIWIGFLPDTLNGAIAHESCK